MTTRAGWVKSRKAGLGLVAAVLAWVAITPVTALASNDPGFGQQWALSGATSSINAPQAWCASTGAGVLVADVDTGADFGHPDLAGKLTPGAAFLSGNGSQSGTAVQDGYGHGTMTTGIITADTNNGIGIAAVAPNSHALIVKVLDDSGQGYASDVAAGVRYAADQGAKVINLSIGSDLPVLNQLLGGSPVPGAIKYAFDKGAIVAAAAGNTSYASSDYNTVAQYALVVGALRRDGTKAGYSTTGNIYAPGGDGNQDANNWILSTTTGSAYAIGTGTSFAAPQAAGTLALLVAKGYSPAAARQRIIDTAVNRNGLPELDAAGALGSSAGCPGTPAVGSPASASSSGGLKLKTLRPVAAAVAAAPPSPSPAPAPSVSPSTLFNVVPNNSPDVAPGATLAQAPPPPGPTPAPLVGGLALLGAIAGYGATWGAMMLVRVAASAAAGPG
jgi:subtilisin family serine protease